jgi:hypothetical protein
MGGVSFVYRGQRVSGLVDCGTGFGGTVSSPIHREHGRGWHGNHATVGNPRQTRLFTAALEVYARAGLFVGPGKFDAAVSVVRPTVDSLNECSLDDLLDKDGVHEMPLVRQSNESWNAPDERNPHVRCDEGSKGNRVKVCLSGTLTRKGRNGQRTHWT